MKAAPPALMSLSILVLAMSSSGGTRSDDPIVLDGSFDDWTDVETAAVDPADAPGAELDFGEIKVSHDREYVHLLVNVGREVNVQQLQGSALLIFDADGNARTGTNRFEMDGIDFALRLTAPSQRRSPMGLALYAPTQRGDERVSPYAAGVAFAPTHASQVVEFRFERGARFAGSPPIFQGRRFRCKLLAFDTSGTLGDHTDAIDYRLDGGPRTEDRPDHADPLARAEDAAVRLMTWNVERGKLIREPDAFLRCVRALEPELILFQELQHDSSAEQLQTLLNRDNPGSANPWRVVFGAGGGDLRCAVAARAEVTEVSAMRLVAFPGNPDRTVRVSGALITMGERRLLAASIHLKCCGGIGGREDGTRQTEVELIGQSLRAALADTPVQGIVIGGDFNLVGGRGPLDTLLDATGLDVARALQIDGRTAATWSDDGQPFIPGRLDYVLCGHGLDRANAFVMDTRDIERGWLTRHMLRPEDGRATDHMPVVVDLRWSE